MKDMNGALPLRVLLVEDDLINQMLLSILLKQRGFVVQTADNGVEALQALQRDGADVILLDIQMPVMNGFETVKAIRQREMCSGAHVPVIALTARMLSGDRKECLLAGMDEYVSKPVTDDMLFEVIHRTVQRLAAG